MGSSGLLQTYTHTGSGRISVQDVIKNYEKQNRENQSSLLNLVEGAELNGMKIPQKNQAFIKSESNNTQDNQQDVMNIT